MRKRLLRFLGVVVLACLTGAGFYTGMVEWVGFWFSWAMWVCVLVIWDEGEKR